MPNVPRVFKETQDQIIIWLYSIVGFSEHFDHRND